MCVLSLYTSATAEGASAICYTPNTHVYVYLKNKINLRYVYRVHTYSMRARVYTCITLMLISTDCTCYRRVVNVAVYNTN